MGEEEEEEYEEQGEECDYKAARERETKVIANGIGGRIKQQIVQNQCTEKRRIKRERKRLQACMLFP